MSPAETLVATYPLLELLVGLAVLTAVILMHSLGVRLVYRHFSFAWAADRNKAAPWHYNFIVVGAIATLAGLHLVATLIWAIPIWQGGLIDGLRDTYFFVLENYTTLGDDTVSLPKPWRLIGPVIAISGLFNFGWTASVFVNMMHDIGKFDRAEAHREHH